VLLFFVFIHRVSEKTVTEDFCSNFFLQNRHIRSKYSYFERIERRKKKKQEREREERGERKKKKRDGREKREQRKEKKRVNKRNKKQVRERKTERERERNMKNIRFFICMSQFGSKSNGTSERFLKNKQFKDFFEKL